MSAATPARSPGLPRTGLAPVLSMALWPFLLLALAVATPGAAEAQAPPTVGEARPMARTLPPPPVTHPGLSLQLGAHAFTVRAGEPEAELMPGGLFSDGATFGVGWIGGIWRVEYLRQVVRHDLPSGTTFRGRPAERVLFESDQAWAHIGWRPGRKMFLGLGLGAQHRRLRFTADDNGGAPTQRTTESGPMAGLLAEWALAPPFLVQLRWIEEPDDGIVQVSGAMFMIAYLISL